MKPITLSISILSILLVSLFSLQIANAEQDTKKISQIEFKIAHETPGANRTEAYVQEENKKLYLGPAKLENSDLKEIEVVEMGLFQNGALLSLTNEGRKKLAETTRNNIGRRLAILVDGQIITSPIIHQPIDLDQVQITGNFTLEEIKVIVESIKKGI